MVTHAEDGGPRKKRHHVVPQSYLRAFADDREMLRSIQREPKDGDNDYIILSVKDAAVERYFYRVHRADGSPCDDLEDALGKFDALIPEIVRRAITEEPLSRRTIDDLKYLYANFAARNGLGRDMLIEEVSEMKSRVARDFEKAFPDESALEHKELLDSVIRGVFDHPEMYSADPETISRLAIIPKSLEVYEMMPAHACVLESTEVELLTSDAPFGAFDPDDLPKATGVYGPAFSSPRVELTLPLDRKHAVLFANIPMPGRAVMSPRGIAVINARTTYYARRFILFHNNEETTNLAWMFVQNYCDFYITPLLEAFDDADHTASTTF